VHHGVHHLQERRASRYWLARIGDDLHGLLNTSIVARAALLIIRIASGLLALQLALGLLAVGGLHTFVGTVEFLAHGRALGLGSSASGVAMSRRADGLALGAAVHLALLLRAANRAHGLLAVDGARRARGLLALHLALGALTHRVADSRAGGIIALPLALRVALLSHNDAD